MTSRAVLCAASLVAVLAAAGCRRGEERNLVMAAPTQAGDVPGASHATPQAAPQAADPALRLSASVRSRWTGMKLGVIDLAERQEATYLVRVGQDFTLPGGGLTFRILALVPDFSLDNGVITSRSEAPSNPAAQVLITEHGRQLYRGWLFARFPESQPFEHPRYAVRLLELEQGAPR